MSEFTCHVPVIGYREIALTNDRPGLNSVAEKDPKLHREITLLAEDTFRSCSLVDTALTLQRASLLFPGAT